MDRHLIEPLLDPDHIITVRAPELPRRLARLLAVRRLTAKRVSELCDVSENTLSKWKHGETTVKVANAMAVARALGVEVHELLGEPFYNGNAPGKSKVDTDQYQVFVTDLAAIERRLSASETPDLMALLGDAQTVMARIASAAPTASADNAAARQLDEFIARARQLRETEA